MPTCADIGCIRTAFSSWVWPASASWVLPGSALMRYGHHAETRVSLASATASCQRAQPVERDATRTRRQILGFVQDACVPGTSVQGLRTWLGDLL